LWAWFCEINRRRSGNGFSANPITYTEVASWAHLKGLKPTPGEVEMLMALDDLFLQALAQEQKRASEIQKKASQKGRQ
jgi:hypothetical protein